MSRIEDLILRSRTGDQEAKAELIEENSGLIWSVARRFTGRGTELEDLYQLGCVGFLKAVEGFDLSFGTQFSTYAVPKISGEIRRFLRDDGAVKVSRGLKEKAMVIRTAQNYLLQLNSRDPTVFELAEKTGYSPEEIAEAESATAAVESIQEPSGSEGLTLESTLTDTETEESVLEKLSLNQAIQELPEREATVIRLRYFHGLTQDRTARLLNVSQVQISRIEKKALEHLREEMIH